MLPFILQYNTMQQACLTTTANRSLEVHQQSDLTLQHLMKHAKSLFQMEWHVSAAFSDVDDKIFSPWIIRCMLGFEMRVFKVTLCNGMI